VNRVLATVMFTNIVSSTERATSLGDTAWHSLLDQHDRRVRAWRDLLLHDETTPA